MGRDFGRLLSPLVRLAVEALSALFAAVFAQVRYNLSLHPSSRNNVQHYMITCCLVMQR